MITVNHIHDHHVKFKIEMQELFDDNIEKKTVVSRLTVERNPTIKSYNKTIIECLCISSGYIKSLITFLKQIII